MRRIDDPYRDFHLEQIIQRKIRMGIGQGVLKYYVPWTNHYSFSSKGRNTLTRGRKIERLFDLFSDLERDYFFLLEYNEAIYDIREQFPLLDRTRALNIAQELGIRYPVYPYSHTPIVMTTDFYIVTRDGSVYVRTIKREEELNNRRILEKFAIEQKYLEREGITNWKVVTEKGINREKARNIALFRDFWELDRDRYYYNKTKAEIQKDIAIFNTIIKEKVRVPINEVVRSFDKSRAAGAGYSLFKHLLAHHQISVDLNEPLDYKRMIQLEGGRIVVN